MTAIQAQMAQVKELARHNKATEDITREYNKQKITADYVTGLAGAVLGGASRAIPQTKFSYSTKF